MEFGFTGDRYILMAKVPMVKRGLFSDFTGLLNKWNEMKFKNYK